MKRCLLLSLLWMVVGVLHAAAAEPQWKQTASSLALVNGEKIVWQFNCEKGECKPYFHPVTVAGGPTLTDLRPADHPWHLALWFSWKFLNGVNSWEPDRKTGKTAGTTEVLDMAISPRPDHSAGIQLKLAYHTPGQPPVLTESRSIEVSPPTAAGEWHIDWQSTFTAGPAEVRLDRTPIVGEPKGVSYGGYAGLSLRLQPTLRPWHFEGAEGPISAANARGRWMAFGGPLPDGKAATILVLDHPQSFRHPTAWYLIGSMPYFSPAVLYRSPHVLPAGQSFSLRYRIMLLPGSPDGKAAEAAWTQFAAEAEQKSK